LKNFFLRFGLFWAKIEIFPRYFCENALKFLQICRFELQFPRGKNGCFFSRYTLENVDLGVKNPENEIPGVE